MKSITSSVCGHRFGAKLAAMVALLGLGVCSLASTAQADNRAVTFGTLGGDINSGSFDSTYGWTFTVNKPILATAVGWGGFVGVPIEQNHQIGIWNSSNSLVAYGIVTPSSFPVGSGGNTEYFTSISPVLLTPGSYTIGGESGVYTGSSGFDAVVDTNVTSLASDPSITYTGGAVTPFTGFTEPIGNTFGASNAYFGPNFLIAATPEPGTLALFATSGLGAVSLLARKRRRK